MRLFWPDAVSLGAACLGAACLGLTTSASAQMPSVQTPLRQTPSFQAAPLPPLQEQQSRMTAPVTAPPKPNTPPATIERPSIWVPAGTAKLQALDKVNAQTTALTIKVGQAVAFGSLTIVVKACEEDDDRTLGWLIFSAAQTPSFGFAESVINNLTKIPGPMTQAALLYYIQCSQAIKLAVYQFSGIGTFKEIYHQRQFTSPPAAAASIPIP